MDKEAIFQLIGFIVEAKDNVSYKKLLNKIKFDMRAIRIRSLGIYTNTHLFLHLCAERLLRLKLSFTAYSVVYFQSSIDTAFILDELTSNEYLILQSALEIIKEG